MVESTNVEMDGLERKWDNLRLSEEEKVGIDWDTVSVDAVREKGERSLIGKICMEREISCDAVATIMTRIWRVSCPAKFQGVGRNLFVITFGTKEDKIRILEGRPWLFDSHLFVLKVFDEFSQPDQWDFSTEVF